MGVVLGSKGVDVVLGSKVWYSAIHPQVHNDVKNGIW